MVTSPLSSGGSPHSPPEKRVRVGELKGVEKSRAITYEPVMGEEFIKFEIKGHHYEMSSLYRRSSDRLGQVSFNTKRSSDEEVNRSGGLQLGIDNLGLNATITSSRKCSNATEVQETTQVVSRAVTAIFDGGESSWCGCRSTTAQVFAVVVPVSPQRTFYGTRDVTADPYVSASLEASSEMFEQIKSHLETAKCVLLWGGDGTGKRTRALEFARRAGVYPYIFHFSTLQVGKFVKKLNEYIEQQPKDLQEKCGSPSADSPDVILSNTIGRFKKLLDLLKGPCLIILANDEEGGTREESRLRELAESLGLPHVHTILINYHKNDEAFKMPSIEIPGLTLKELTRIVQMRDKFQREDELQQLSSKQIGDLGELAQWSPSLLVRWLNDFCHSECSFDQFLDVIKNDPPSLDQTSEDQTSESSRTQNGARIFCEELIKKRISEQVPSPVKGLCCDILMLSSCLGRTIPKTLLNKWFEINRTKFKPAELEAKLTSALTALMGFYVIRIDKGDVVVNAKKQRNIAKCFSLDEQKEYWVTLTAVLCNFFKFDGEDPATWNSANAMFPQVESHLNCLLNKNRPQGNSSEPYQNDAGVFDRLTGFLWRSAPKPNQTDWYQNLITLIVRAAAYRTSMHLKIPTSLDWLSYGEKLLNGENTAEIFKIDTSLTAKFLLELSTEYAFSSKPAFALRCLDRLEGFYRELSGSRDGPQYKECLEKREFVKSLYIRMDILRVQGNVDEALSIGSESTLEKLEEVCSSETVDPNFGKNVGNLFHNSGLIYGGVLLDGTQAKKAFDRSMPYIGYSGRREGLAMAAAQAYAEGMCGEVNKAIKSLRASKEQMEEQGIKQGLLYDGCKFYLAEMLRQQGETQQDKKVLMEASALFEGLSFPIPYYQAIYLMHYGALLLNLHRLGHSVDLVDVIGKLKDAVQLYDDKLDNRLYPLPALGRAYFYWGRALEAQGKPRIALGQYRKSKAVFDAFKNHPWEADCDERIKVLEIQTKTPPPTS